MDKTELLRAMRDGHAGIAAAVAALSDEAMLAEAPGMPGWTRKDVLAHIEFWHDHSADVLAGLRTGVDPYADWPTEIDPFNARVLAENRGRSADEVRAGEAASFARLTAAVEGASDHELFDRGLVSWLDRAAAEDVAGDTFDHYPDHAAQLAAG
jgi:hypothetical protein